MSYINRFKAIFLQASLLALFMSGLGVSSIANAAGGNDECPVGLVTDKEMDEEFGPRTSELTKCLDRRNNVKIVMQLNKFCRDAVSNAQCQTANDPKGLRAYALGNLKNMIKDYEITHGMVPGRDYEIAVVVHSGGIWQMLTNTGLGGDGTAVSDRNQYQGVVEGLIADGVEFYLCQNTTRKFIATNKLPMVGEGLSEGGATAELIEGVNQVTAGVTAIADFQSSGYRYVQP